MRRAENKFYLSSPGYFPSYCGRAETETAAEHEGCLDVEKCPEKPSCGRRGREEGQLLQLQLQLCPAVRAEADSGGGGTEHCWLSAGPARGGREPPPRPPPRPGGVPPHQAPGGGGLQVL